MAKEYRRLVEDDEAYPICAKAAQIPLGKSVMREYMHSLKVWSDSAKIPIATGGGIESSPPTLNKCFMRTWRNWKTQASKGAAI